MLPALDLTLQPSDTSRKRGRSFKGDLDELNKEYREAVQKAKVEGKPVKVDKIEKEKKAVKEAREPKHELPDDSRKAVEPVRPVEPEKPEAQMTE